ncbi:MAG: hypothetical protein A2Y77_16565 [Planctomycetes bacterium RBG_13_62_9]|nr:MAG: hypothetical protein A2Y77_16565 [Planctomycetes bacterium RBG_13_62_9]
MIYPPGVSGPPLLPDFDPPAFVLPTLIDNPYFPLMPGTVYTYSGQFDEDGETVTETSRVFVTPDTRNIAGVESRVVRDTEFVNGILAEDTFDWYAQDVVGNVWYMGEFTTSFEYDDEGNLIGTSNEGSWEAGVDGAMPGYIMLANPQVGDHYYQEFFPGEAEDEAVVVALNQSISTGLGDFTNVLQTYETTALEPDAREFKYYAPGIGLVLIEEDLDEDLMDPGLTVELTSVEVIPAPAALPLLIVGLGALSYVRRRVR